MSGDEIRAYVLFGCLLAVYPVFAGVKAIEKAFGPEVAVYDGCRYEVFKQSRYLDTMSLRPLDKDAEACIEKRKKESDEEAVFDYQQAHRKHHPGDEVNR